MDVHADGLGGLGFLIGDGCLTYRPEMLTELSCDARVAAGLNLTAHIKFVAKPGHKADRGPVMVFGGRVRVAFRRRDERPVHVLSCRRHSATGGRGHLGMTAIKPDN